MPHEGGFLSEVESLRLLGWTVWLPEGRAVADASGSDNTDATAKGDYGKGGADGAGRL